MENVARRLSWVLVAALALLLIAALAGVAQGGPLDPPGPVAPTGKNVITSLPFTISQPGSYILNGNLTGVSGQDGITVNAANVTIDLQGFELVGVPGAVSGISGASLPNLTIRNGTVRNWPARGVIALSGSVDNLAAISNGVGIQVTERAALNNCRVEGSTSGNGILVGPDSVVRGCTAINNIGSEIVADHHSLIEDCLADGAGTGGYGIYIVSNGVVRDCTATNNGDIEILGGTGTTLENCVADGAGTFGGGIQVGDDSRVRGCKAKNNGNNNIQAGNRAVVENSTASGGGNHGIYVGDNSTVRGCTATDHFGSEIIAGDRSVIEDCIADGFSGSGNSPGHGISVSSNTVVRGCTAQNNAWAGVSAAGSNNRIESNHVIFNSSQGVNVDAGSNVIASNSASANSPNYEIAPGNQYSPAGPVSGATNPWANIEY
jgi:parallel beta-helix repeat protein